MNVLISQRVDVIAQRNERRDALDQAWGETLAGLLGQRVLTMPVPNRPDEVDALLLNCRPGMLVLSGGNDIGPFPERDATETRLLDGALRMGLPVLAVCRGMQMLQHYLGGGLIQVSGHVRIEHEVTAVPGQSLAPLVVNSYHEWGIGLAGLAADLRGLYQHADGSVEAVTHAVMPWVGVMWHPERGGSGMAKANEWLSNQLRKGL